MISGSAVVCRVYVGVWHVGLQLQPAGPGRPDKRRGRTVGYTYNASRLLAGRTQGSTTAGFVWDLVSSANTSWPTTAPTTAFTARTACRLSRSLSPRAQPTTICTTRSAPPGRRPRRALSCPHCAGARLLDRHAGDRTPRAERNLSDLFPRSGAIPDWYCTWVLVTTAWATACSTMPQSGTADAKHLYGHLQQ